MRTSNVTSDVAREPRSFVRQHSGPALKFTAARAKWERHNRIAKAFAFLILAALVLLIVGVR